MSTPPTHKQKQRTHHVEARESKTTAVLLTFTGFHDPFTRGLVGEEDQAGPILTLVSVWQFGQIVLFSTPSTREISAKTLEAIKQRQPGIEVRIIDLDLADPTDYRAILGNLRTQIT